MGRYRDRVAGRADFQRRVNAGGLQELNLDFLQDELLEAWRLDAQFVTPGRQRGDRVITVSVVTVLYSVPAATFRTMTSARATTAPFGSLTAPVIVPRSL